jgi:hypothetical protein
VLLAVFAVDIGVGQQFRYVAGLINGIGALSPSAFAFWKRLIAHTPCNGTQNRDEFLHGL